MADSTEKKGFLGSFLSLPNDNPKKTLFVAIMLCLVCSILVSTAAVSLKPLQTSNKKVIVNPPKEQMVSKGDGIWLMAPKRPVNMAWPS